MGRFVWVFVAVLAACSPRGEIVFAPATAHVAPGRAIFVGTTRGPDPETGAPLSRGRLEHIAFAQFDVAVPPDRQPGDIRFTPKGMAPDPERDFLATGEKFYADAPAFRADLTQTLRANGNEAVVFVHGYNNTLAEGLYRFAQMGHDLHLPGVLVHYSWPSMGHPLGYAYDRDSALFARDGFVALLDEVAAAGAKRIIIVAHSMGASLTMETLRQMALTGNTRVPARLGGVVLISPDLDVDLFRAQARTIGHLPQPFVIFTSQRDRALRLAARLSGETERLGNLDNVDRLADLQVTMVEVGAYSVGDGHFTVGRSPALIALMGQTGALAAALDSDQSTRAGLLPGVVLTVHQATQIVLAPVQQIASDLAN
ncbi:alpha/beta hydrolase [Phaeovulum sp.]|uniref:alpha/beta hydrolase n=1 Tax=Phaeovulum sp. TaxID=2934796 RepID=UPI0039E2650D